MAKRAPKSKKVSRKGFKLSAKTKRTLKRVFTPENVIILLGTVIVPLVLGILEARRPPIIIEE